MKTQLKIKICSLAAESKIIRREELRWAKKVTYTVTNPKTGETKQRVKYIKKDHPVAESLRTHRRTIVRDAARYALLAYGFLRGRPLFLIEAKARTCPDWTRVIQNIKKFGDCVDERIMLQKFEQWKQSTFKDGFNYAEPLL